jgi:23S rRNA pseudouridine1911/1915/1917 synthase
VADRSVEPIAIVVTDAEAGERIDRVLAGRSIGLSRSAAQRLIRDGHVRIDGTVVRDADVRPRAGADVIVLPAPPPPSHAEPEAIPLRVLHEDDDLLVLDKPAGLVVHPGPGHAHGTLVHGLLREFPEIAGVGDPERPGIVHRLDRDTSGLLVVARTEDAARALVEALAAREVDRRYLALVGGIPDARRGAIDAPIGRSTRQRTRMAVREGGRPARTAYEVAAEWPDRDVALLECRLESGRTHQIRVHLGAIGHPVVGDLAYGGRPGTDLGLDRPFLHATSLGFEHPVTGERLDFESRLPGELAAAIAALGVPATD